MIQSLITDKHASLSPNISNLSLSQHAREILGTNGATRFLEFSAYKHNWDGNKATPMSFKSLQAMEYFLHKYCSFQSEPSLFLSPEGNLVLGWEDAGDNEIEIEFYADYAAYYIESLDDEGDTSNGEIDDLIQKIQSA